MACKVIAPLPTREGLGESLVGLVAGLGYGVWRQTGDEKNGIKVNKFTSSQLTLRPLFEQFLKIKLQYYI